LEELTGVLKGLRFGDVFILRNGHYVIFKEITTYMPGVKEDKIKNAKSIMDLGDFYFTDTGSYVYYNSNGTRGNPSRGNPSSYDIIEKLKLSPIETQVYKILENNLLVGPDPILLSVDAVKEIIEFFKEMNESIDGGIKHELKGKNIE
jgi:hypothetical protein